MLDRFFSVFILCILVVATLHFYGQLMQRAEVLSNAITGFETYRRGIAYQWAVQGVWSDNEGTKPGMKIVPSNVTDNRFNGTVGVEDGAIHIHAKVTSNEDILSCRPAYLKDNPTGPVTWICGANVALEPGWSVQGPDRTTINNELIPIQLR